MFMMFMMLKCGGRGEDIVVQDDNNGAGASTWQTLLNQCVSPWRYLEIVREYTDVGDRPQLFDPWLALVTKCPRPEQEALIAQAGREGWNLWKMPVGVMRDGLKALAKEDLGQLRARATVATDECVAEMIYNPNMDQATGGRCKSPYAYLVQWFDKLGDPPEVVDRIKVGRVVYVPPMFDESLEGTVLFPTGYEDYGSEHALHQLVLDYLANNMQLEADELDLVATFVQFTWIADCVDVTPYLRTLGDWGSGKSTLQRVAGSIAHRGIFAAGAATASPLFRLIDATRGTLCLDEADHSSKSEMWQEIEKVLLTGHSKGHKVLRAESSANGGFGVRAYDCYGPKIIGMRRVFKDAALESRCLTITMPLVTLGPGVPLFGDDQFRGEAAQLRNKLILWRLRRYQYVDANPRDRVPGLDNRLMAVTLALLAITDDPIRRDRIFNLVRAYGVRQRVLRQESLEGKTAQVLLDVWASFAAVQPITAEAPVEFPLKTVTERLRSDGLQSLTPRRVGELLRTLGFQTQLRGGLTYCRLTGLQARQLVDLYGASLAWAPRTPTAPRT